VDDALSCEHKEGGYYTIGVHIADVSRFVLPGTLLDKVTKPRLGAMRMRSHLAPARTEG
jgi:exoribonuclease R